jgi:hypothetical protein
MASLMMFYFGSLVPGANRCAKFNTSSDFLFVFFSFCMEYGTNACTRVILAVAVKYEFSPAHTIIKEGAELCVDLTPYSDSLFNYHSPRTPALHYCQCAA